MFRSFLNLVLLNEAILPNLVQTVENTPAFVHAGPFANLAHGTSSVISQKIALRLADFAVNEAGFDADLGAEKYFDIVMRSSGIKPSVTVLVATVRALAYQGAAANDDSAENVESLNRGLNHLGKHIENLKKFNVPGVVAINRFYTNADEELSVIQEYCRENSVECAVADVFAKGSEGAIDLAEKVIAVAEKSDSEAARSLYDVNLSLEQKIEIVAKEIYGAEAIYFETAAPQKTAQICCRFRKPVRLHRQNTVVAFRQTGSARRAEKLDAVRFGRASFGGRGLCRRRCRNDFADARTARNVAGDENGC